jgi:hypothetical protein
MKHSIERQLTVALENQPGRLAAVCVALAQGGVNIRDLTVLDNVEQGVIRLVTSDAPLAKSILNAMGLYIIEAEVVIVDLQDSPGALAALCSALAEGQVNIDYAYGSEDPTGHRMRLILKVSPVTRACEILTRLGA